MARHLVGDELVVVDGVVEGLTHANVVEGGLLAVEHQERQSEAVDVLDLGARALDLVGVGVRTFSMASTEPSVMAVVREVLSSRMFQSISAHGAGMVPL